VRSRTAPSTTSGRTGGARTRAADPYEHVDTCTEFERRRGDDGDEAPAPEPEPPPVCEGQVDMFEVFADQIVEHVEQLERVP